MKTLKAQRGKNLNVGLPWAEFILTNTDIMTTLTRAPLAITRTDEGRYSGKVFGVKITMETIRHENLGTKGSIRILADVRLPLGLGRTYTVATHRYFAIDDHTTSVDLDLSMELTRLMRVYVWFRRGAVDVYLNRLCSDIEQAAQMLESCDDRSLGLLDEEQRARVTRFRRGVRADRSIYQYTKLETEGLIRVAVANDVMVITVEAKMPDEQVLCALENLPFDNQTRTELLSGTTRLARINNNAFPVRGLLPDPAENVEFRQAALEFGYGFFKRMCSGELTEIMAALCSQGHAAAIRLTVAGAGEDLPWEAMHDGHDFLCLKLRFSRCVTSIQGAVNRPKEWTTSGILIVGADPRGDLPGAEDEAEDIGNLLTTAGMPRVEVLKGHNANRRSVVGALESGGFNILHFSGHSLFDSQYPYQSCLELAGDSRIYLHELGRLGRKAQEGAPLDMAFLNSCQSALVGQDKVTGRQLSLCRALREAGVDYVVGMLWNVEDKAAVQVGSVFYSSLLANPDMGPEEAMRRTRQRVATDRAWADGSWLAPVLYV